MKIRTFSLTFLLAMAIFTIAACGGDSSTQQQHNNAPAQDATQAAPHGDGAEFTSAYICPMHCPGSGSDQPGTCPKCGMDYVAQADHVKDGHKH